MNIREFIEKLLSPRHSSLYEKKYTIGCNSRNQIRRFRLEAGSDKLAKPVISCARNIVTITVPKGSIRYTVDGSTPTHSSALYSSPITITEDTDFNAIAEQEGYLSSDVTEYEAVYVPICASPVISCENNTVIMTCSTEGAVIKYITPPQLEQIHTYNNPIEIIETTIFHARAEKSGYVTSNPVEYTAEYVEP